MNRTDNPELAQQILSHIADLYKIRETREANHLSSYISCLTRTFLDQQQTSLPTDEEVMLFALGYALQDVLTPKDADAPVLTKDGIIYRPDMIIDNRLVEVKTTRRSAKYHHQDVPETWLDYMMGGCTIQGTNHYDLVVLYMSGNYAPPAPLIYADTFVFDREELDRHWHWILVRKNTLDKALNTRTPPAPFEHNHMWECKFCRYRLVCDAISAQGADNE